MPAIFTHVEFGNQVAATLPTRLQELIKRHPAAFYLGTQGPDILFYHKVSKSKGKNPVRKKGWDMHAQSAAPFFERVAKRLLTHPDEENEAYALGFLCHFTLDSHCHPFIDERSVDGLSHGKIEAELDKYYLRKTGYPVRGFNAATLFFPYEEAVSASALLLEVPTENMQIAINSMRKINRLFSHKRGFVHGFCHAALTLVGMNKSFGEMFLYKKDDERCAPLLPTLSALFDEAVEKANEKIIAFFGDLEKIASEGLTDNFYRYNYSGKEER